MSRPTRNKIRRTISLPAFHTTPRRRSDAPGPEGQVLLAGGCGAGTPEPGPTTMDVVGLIDQLGYRVPEANALQRLVWKVSSSRPGAWLFAKTLHHADRLVLRLTRNHVTVPGVLAGLPVIALATTGARTGQRRDVPLVGVPSGDQDRRDRHPVRPGPKRPAGTSTCGPTPEPRSGIGAGRCPSSPGKPRATSAGCHGREAARCPPATRRAPRIDHRKIHVMVLGDRAEADLSVRPEWWPALCVKQWPTPARRTSTWERWRRNSGEALRSAGGSVPSSARAAASADAPPASGRLDGGGPQRRRAHVDQADAGRSPLLRTRGDADDRPVLGAALELLERPRGAVRPSAPGSRSAARRAPAPSPGSPVKKSSTAIAARRRARGRRASPAAPAARPAGRTPGRRGRSTRRSCRGGVPAGRRSGRRPRPAAAPAAAARRRSPRSW